MKSVRQQHIFLMVMALLMFGISARVARAQSVITTVAGGGAISSPPLANICLPVTAVTSYGGNTYFVSCNRVYRLPAQGQATVIAGTGAQGFSGDGGAATNATFNSPFGIAFDQQGDLFISDTGNNRIREVNASTGIVQTVAGTGVSGYSGDGGAALSAEFSDPEGIAIDAAGNIFIADSLNGRVREIIATSGNVTTIAGGGTTILQNSSTHILNNIPATSIQFLGLTSVLLDGNGNLYLSDVITVGKMSLATGNFQIIAGGTRQGGLGDGGQAILAELNNTGGISIDSAGDVFISDTLNECVREVVAATGIIQDVWGDRTDGTATGATSALSVALIAPRGMLVDGSGNIFVTSETGLQELLAGSGNVVTVAGSLAAGYNGDNQPATSATLFVPHGVTVDGAGNLFIADSFNDRVREVRAADGKMVTLAGDGTGPVTISTTSVEPWSIGIGGSPALVYFVERQYDGVPNQIMLFPVPTANGLYSVNPATGVVSGGGPLVNDVFGYLSNPSGLFIDNSGNAFIADTGHSEIVEVTSGSSTANVVAGVLSPGSTIGDGGPATSATLLSPMGIFVDAAGNIFIPDTGHQRIREVTVSNGNIQTLAGNGTASFGGSGDGGAAANAEFFNPEGVAVDFSGNIFIADTGNNRVREVVAVTGNIQTIAGTGAPGFSGDGGLATNAQLNQPTGLAFDLQGNLLIVDSYNSRIRKLVAPAPAVSVSTTSLSFSGQLFGTTSSAMTVTLTNSGNETLSVSAAPSISGTNSGDFAVASGTTCTSGATLALGASCVVNVTFTPGAAGNRGTATLTIANSATSSSTLSLTGIGTDFSLGAQTSGSTSATVTAGQTATYNLQVAPTGYNGTVNLSCSGTPVAATCTVSPSSLSVTGSAATMFAVTVTTTARGVALGERRLPVGLDPLPTILLMAAAGLCFALFRSRRKVTFALMALTLLGITVAGCGGGSSSSNAGTGTPAGASTLTINATSGGVTRTMQLSLTVN